MGELMTILCAAPDCLTPVSGIYCDKHKAQRAQVQLEVREARSERMKKMWEERGEELKEKIAAGRAPAKEEK